MENNPAMEVGLKGQETTNQIFLSPIENFPYIKENNLFLSIEYYLCTGISVFLWNYFTISAGFKSYNFILKNKYVSDYAYLSKFRDYNDNQWKYFHQHLISFILISIIFVFISKIIKKYIDNQLKLFYAFSGIIFSFYLVQLRMLYILFAAIIFYFSKDLVKLGVGTFNIICWVELFAIKYFIKYMQYSFDINNFKYFKVENDIDDLSWEILLIYSLLKMMSFNLEYKAIFNNESVPESIFNLNQAKSHCMQCYDGNFCTKCLENTIIGEKEKIDDSFNFINFISYIFYPPLLYSGPLINYNSFIFQINIYKDSQHNNLIKMNKLLYLLKLIFYLAVMEIYNHFLFPIFLFKNKDNQFEPNADISVFYYCFICLNILTFIWLKYTIIWKLFRLWAWSDGIFVEENINRFIYNFYSIELFFRGINRSLNRWMVRYIYIPLGGKNKKYVNIWIVFGFWYLIVDYKNIDYAVFALCCCLFIDLEMFVRNTFIEKFGEDFNEKIYLRFIKYIFSALYLFAIFVIGLLGFFFSLDNLKVVFATVVNKGGYLYFINFVLFLLPNVVMMFFIRDMELEDSVLYHKKPLNY